MKLRHLVLALGLALPGVAWSAQCDSDLEKADAAIAAGPKATVIAEDFEQAKQLRVMAAEMLKTGDDVGCVATVGQALELLDVAESD